MTTILRQGKKVVVRTKLTPDSLKVLRSLPRVTWVGRDAVLAPSPRVLELLRSSFPDATWDDSLREELDALDHRAEAMREVAKRKHVGLAREDDPYEFGTEPHDKQRLFFQLSRDLPAAGFFMEAGTGKTKLYLDTAVYLWSEDRIEMLVVLAPNGPHREVVTVECPKHVPAWARWRGDYYVSGMGKRRTAAMEELIAAPKGDFLKVISVNLEAIQHKSGFEFVERLLKTHRAMLVIDESQRIKTPSAIRTRNAWKLRPLAEYRRIATGSEVDEGVENLYAQMAFLDPDIIGAKTYTEFKSLYCVLYGQYDQIVGYKNLDDLKRRVDPYVFQATRDECFDLPERQYVEHEVELSPEQRRLYDQLLNEFVAELEDGSLVEAPLMITRLGRLHQVLCGFLKTEDDRVQLLPCPRVELVAEHVAEQRRKSIVWTRYRPDIVQLSAALEKRGIRHVTHHGGTKDRKGVLEAFRTDPKVSVLLATQQSAGVGLTLNEAKQAFFYSQSWSYEDRNQTEARNYRHGQTEKVVYHDYVARGTVDVKIRRAHREKREVVNQFRDPTAVLEWLKTL